MVGMLVSRSPMMFRSMQNFEGKVPRTGWVFKATGLYFFFATKATRGVSEGKGGQSGCDREHLLETSVS